MAALSNKYDGSDVPVLGKASTSLARSTSCFLGRQPVGEKGDFPKTSMLGEVQATQRGPCKERGPSKGRSHLGSGP